MSDYPEDGDDRPPLDVNYTDPFDGDWDVEIDEPVIETAGTVMLTVRTHRAAFKIEDWIVRVPKAVALGDWTELLSWIEDDTDNCVQGHESDYDPIVGGRTVMSVEIGDTWWAR